MVDAYGICGGGDPRVLLYSVGIPAIVEQPQIKGVNFWSYMENSISSRSVLTVFSKA